MERMAEKLLNKAEKDKKYCQVIKKVLKGAAQKSGHHWNVVGLEEKRMRN